MEKDKELVGRGVIEQCTAFVVVVVNHVLLILVLWRGGDVVYDAKALCALYAILKVDIEIVALAVSLL